MEDGCFFKIGEKIGDYEIIKPLGSVFYGEVYLVKHQMLQVESVMRVIVPDKPQPFDSDEFLHRMQKLYTIRHPNLVGITYFAQDKGNHLSFAFSEYVEGATVSGYMKSNPDGIPVSQALDIVRKIASALGEISSHGLVHCNIRPSNIFLTADHGVKLSDLESASSNKPFPLAAAASNPEQLPPPEQLRYYAPEIGLNESTDIRSDIYSLGMVLYFMLAGKIPFHSQTSVLLLGEMLYAELPAPGTIRKDIPAALDKFVLRMTAKNPEDRPQTPEQLLQELEILQQELAPNTVAPQKTAESGPKSPAAPEPPKNGLPKFQLRMPSAVKNAQPPPPPAAAVEKTVTQAQPPAAAPVPKPTAVAVSPKTEQEEHADMAAPELEDYGEAKGNEELLVSEVDGKQYQKTPFAWKNLPSMMIFVYTKIAETIRFSGKEFLPVIILCVCCGAGIALGLYIDVASLLCGSSAMNSNVSSFRAYKDLPALTNGQQRKIYQRVLAGEGDPDSIRMAVQNKKVHECIHDLCQHNEPDAYLIAATLKMLHPDGKGKSEDFLPLMEKAAELGSLEAASFLLVWHKCGGDPKKAENYEKICRAILQEMNRKEEK